MRKAQPTEGDETTRPLDSAEGPTRELRGARSIEVGPPASAAGAVQVGDRIGRYVLTAELGQGGMGRVFVAHDHGLDRLVAIKFIKVNSAEMVARFMAEARATARCVHPNIVAVHEIGQHRDAPYLVLEHLPGPSLSRMIRGGERLAVPRVIAIMTSVARALACAHSHGIVHRDLKPSNIAVLADDAAKVLDFGIAAYAQSHVADDDNGTARRHGGEVAGTLPYMAPEQVAGAAIDGRADLWAFGVVLYQLLAGVRPFDHLVEPVMRLELLDLDRPVPSITVHRTDLPPALVRVVARCLEKPRGRRFRSANELVVALQRLAGDHAACELPLWMASAPSAEEGDRVALGLVRALASAARGGIDVAATRVWPDGRVELAATPDAVSGPADVRAVATFARQAIDSVVGVRTPTERRRARRMQRVLAPVVRPMAPRVPSARRLARRLTAAHTPPRWRIVAVLAVAMVVAAVAVWSRATQAPQAASVSPALARQLERLEEQVARLRDADDVAAADALFERFVAQPENAPLRSEAWLRRSARELAARELEPALTSAAAGLLAAPSEADATRAVAAVIAVQVARRRWDEVDRGLDELGATRDPAMARAAAAVAIATRRGIPSGPALSPGMTAAARLLVGQQAPADLGAVQTIDVDGDGQDEVIAVHGGVMRALRPDGSSLWQTSWPGGAIRLHSMAGGPSTCAGRDARGAWFAAIDVGAVRLFRVDAAGAMAVFETASADWCALGDLDGDGAVELYVAGARELIRHRAAADGAWQSTRLSLGSEVNALTAVDLDGDGRRELAIALAEWLAYDVRVLAGADLTMVDRIRLGRVASLAALSRGPDRPQVLLARKDWAWPSKRYLPADRPSGAPDGFYVLRLEGGRLRVASHRAETMEDIWGGLHAVDLDGDGRDEAVSNELSTVTRQRRAWVLQLDDHDALDSTTIEGVTVLETGRFASGPGDAVLALVDGEPQRSWWWLGLGATPMPPIAEVAPDAVEPMPAALDATLATTWRRASLLDRLGATASALAAFEQLAAVLPPALQSPALARVLELRVRRGEPLGAVYEALAGHAAPGSAAHLAALKGALAAAVDDGELAAAQRAIDAALRAPGLGAAERGELEAMRERIRPREVTLFDRAPLDDTWDVLDPIGVRRDPVTRALVLDGFGSRRLATVDLTPTEGPIELTVTATITRAEWSAGISVALRPMTPTTQPAVFGLQTIGGGGAYRLAAEQPGRVVAEWPHHAVDRPVTVQVHATWFPDADRTVWDFTVDGEHVRFVEQRDPVAAGRWRLEITSTGVDRDERPSRMAMSVTRIAVAGLAPMPAASPGGLAEARRALANGDHARVLALLARDPSAEAALIAAVRALRVGDRAAAATALARVRDQPVDDAAALALAHLLRVEDGAYAREVLAASGPERSALIARAWTTLARQHPDAELVQRELTQNLRNIELPAGGDAPMLLMRARAHAAIGELAEADADLDALLAQAESLAPAVLADVYVEQARVAVRRGDEAAARRALLAALTASPWPEAVADTVLLDPELEPLAAHPALERVRAIGRRVAAPDGT